MITIRVANANDAGMIADMSRQTFYDSFVRQNTKENMDKFMNEQFTRDELMKEVITPGNIFFLASHKDEPAGYVRLREKNNPAGLQHVKAIEIARLYSATPLIGKGVGRLLMLKCFEFARQKKISTLWLGVWEHNHRAIEFYRRFGFEKFSTHTFMLGNDAQTDWLMKKTLNPLFAY